MLVYEHETLGRQAESFESPNFLVHDRCELLEDHVGAGGAADQKLSLTLSGLEADTVEHFLIG